MHGVVLKKTLADKRMKQKIINPRILLLRGSLGHWDMMGENARNDAVPLPRGHNSGADEPRNAWVGHTNPEVMLDV